MVKKIQPTDDRVLLKILEPKEKTKGGIVLPDTAKEKPQEGKIIAVGPGKLKDDGSRIPMQFKEGQRVLFSKYSGNEFTAEDGEELLLVKSEDILAILS